MRNQICKHFNVEWLYCRLYEINIRDGRKECYGLTGKRPCDCYKPQEADDGKDD